jgi:hypothetical protein
MWLESARVCCHRLKEMQGCKQSEPFLNGKGALGRKAGKRRKEGKGLVVCKV